MSNIIWQPQPKQFEFLSRSEDEVLYGGAAGGGKSDALVIEALRQVHIPHYRGLLVRKTYPQCAALIDKTQDYYTKAYPNAKYNSSNHVWVFPSGAKIYFGSLQYAKDKIKYQGQNYDFIGIDELTHFTYEEYVYLKSRNRPSGKDTRVYMRMTCNPGGVGHAWVKKQFIDGKIPGETYTDEIDVNGVKYYKTSAFIPASVFDNQILLDNDPNYVATLGSLPEAERKALLYGDWDSFSGQVFTEFRDNPEGYKSMKYTHVIEPFEIPKHWRRYRSFDFGYTKPFSVGWWAVDEEGRLYRYRELYGCTNEPDTGLKWNPDQIAKAIVDVENAYEKGNLINGVADPAIWDVRYGEESSPAQVMEKHGIYFEPADHSRLAGKMQVHCRLQFDEQGYPMMYVFNTCKDFIRTIPSLVYDETKIEDVDTKGEDHIYDESRYMMMVNPIKSKPLPCTAKGGIPELDIKW